MLKKFYVSIGIISVGCCCFSACKKEEITFTGEEIAIVETVQEEGTIADEDSQTLENNQSKEQSEDTELEFVIVHICGAVKEPGVYTLPKGSRIYDGVLLAGGFLEEASLDYVNQAMELLDGVQVIIPTKQEIDELDGFVQEGQITTSNSSFGVVGENTGSVDSSSGLININTADESQLCTITGVGESRAKSIIAYREEVGLFQEIADIMKVAGIKEGSFDAMKDEITVN